MYNINNIDSVRTTYDDVADERTLEELTGYDLASVATWEDTPFRSNDDVVLLGFGFHYGSDSGAMYKVKEDGTTWTVKIDRTVPCWYRNGKRVGSRSYDDVVNEFKLK